MNPLLENLLDYLASQGESSIVGSIEDYFNSGNPSAATTMSDILSDMTNDFAQLEQAVANLLVAPYAFNISSTQQTYTDIFKSGKPSQQNLADFATFLDVSSTTGLSTIATQLWLALFNQEIPFNFANPASSTSNTPKPKLASITGTPYMITSAYTPILPGTTDLNSWGDSMLNLYTQVLCYYSSLSYCAYMAATMLEQANGWTDEELAANLNVNPAIWQGGGLGSAIVDQLNANILSNGMQSQNEYYVPLFAFYNNLFLQPTTFNAGFVNLDNNCAIECGQPNMSTQWGGSNNASTAFCDNAYNGSASQSFQIVQTTESSYPGWALMNNQINGTNNNLGWYNLYFLTGDGPAPEWFVATTNATNYGSIPNALWKFYPYSGGVGQSIAFFLVNNQHTGVLQTHGIGDECFEFNPQDLNNINQMFYLQASGA